MIILDTNIISELMKGDRTVISRLLTPLIIN